MGNYVDITIRVPKEQTDDWMTVLQRMEVGAIHYDKGRIIDDETNPQYESAEALNCEIRKVKDSSKIFDPEVIRQALANAKTAFDVGSGVATTIAKAFSV